MLTVPYVIMSLLYKALCITSVSLTVAGLTHTLITAASATTNPFLLRHTTKPVVVIVRPALLDL